MSHRDETIKLSREIAGAKPADPRPAFVLDEAVRTKVIGTNLPIPPERLDFMQKQLVKPASLAGVGDL
jgi:hypothetical protein